jgi:hypothetical protein
MSEPVVAREAAEGDFDRWLSAMRLSRKADPNVLNDEDKKALAEAKGVLIGAIMDGNLVVDENGLFVFTPYNGGDAITFYKPKGSTLMATDKAKQGEFVSKQLKFMGEMTRVGVARYANMDWDDLTVCLTIVGFFTAPG